MDGLASLSVKSVIPTSCCNIPKIKEYLVDIEKREVKEGDNDQFQDKKQTLLLKITEPESRNQISIVAHVHVNNIIKEMLKFYDLINLNNLRGTKRFGISILISAEPSYVVRSIKGLLHPTPPPLPAPTDNTKHNPERQRAGAGKPATATEGSGRGFCWLPSGVAKYRDTVNFQHENLMLVLALLVAALTFSAACSFAGMVSKHSETERDYSSLTGPFVLLNSAGFIASVVVIISVLHQLPLKPWPQISMCSWFGSYMCLMMKLSPHEALLLLCVSVPFLVLAAAGKLFRFSQS